MKSGIIIVLVILLCIDTCNIKPAKVENNIALKPVTFENNVRRKTSLTATADNYIGLVRNWIDSTGNIIQFRKPFHNPLASIIVNYNLNDVFYAEFWVDGDAFSAKHTEGLFTGYGTLTFVNDTLWSISWSQNQSNPKPVMAVNYLHRDSLIITSMPNFEDATCFYTKTYYRATAPEREPSYRAYRLEELKQVKRAE